MYVMVGRFNGTHAGNGTYTVWMLWNKGVKMDNFELSMYRKRTTPIHHDANNKQKINTSRFKIIFNINAQF